MRGNSLAGPSSHSTNTADSAVRLHTQQLYNTSSPFPLMNSDFFGGLTNSEKNNMPVSTLAAITASTSGGLSAASAFASVFGQDILGTINRANSSKTALNLSKGYSPNIPSMETLIPRSTSHSTIDESLNKSFSVEKTERKPKGGKIEDIIKRIRDKKTD